MFLTQRFDIRGKAPKLRLVDLIRFSHSAILSYRSGNDVNFWPYKVAVHNHPDVDMLMFTKSGREGSSLLWL